MSRSARELPGKGSDGTGISRPFERTMGTLVILVSAVFIIGVFGMVFERTGTLGRKLAESQAQFVAQQVAAAIGELEEPQYWEFNGDKISLILTRAMRPAGMKNVHIYNPDRELVAEKMAADWPPAGKGFRSEAPIVFNNRVQGYVETFMSPPGLQRNRIYLLVFFSVCVVASGVLFFVIPVRAVKRLEGSLIRSYGELKELNENLERKVRERTDNLNQALQDLQRSQDKLVQSEKMSAIGQLAAGVAHEINNPLGIIMGFAQSVVQKMKPGDPIEMPLRSIEREAVRCKNLVQDLLTFSRSDRSDHVPVDLNGAVEVSLGLVNAGGKMNSVEIKKEFAQGLPRFLGSVNQIQQVVINLASNAIDAMPKGGDLTITTGVLKEGTLSWVYMKVSDTGEGISKDVQSKIFEPFYTTKPVGKGTGLGLSLVYEIVKKHSGAIELQSRPGFTEFCVKFPVRS
ncbi:MAG: hypothetical protein A2902_04250 [Elusimicrobia bacterium RIFCSPLOWO2_01_FULL_64_13]|nr:MAG: hypothetical protein A2902_04250 [Elusimicrobia bacterium RIFCSPLOWO2_01_FULL_64_13]